MRHSRSANPFAGLETRPSRGRLVVALAAALALLVPLSAQADPQDDARRRFQQGLELARSGDIDDALALFLEADAIYEHPATTYNIAYAYQRKGDLNNALIWYRKLLVQAPERADRVNAVIAEIEQEIAQRQATVVVATDGGGTALAADEIARLRAIAAELEALAEKVAERPSTGGGTGEGSGGEGTGGEGTGPSMGDGDGGGFQDDAYQRVVVTASRYGQDPLDSPSTVSVLTEEDIRLSGATDVPELLRRVAGVDVMSMAAGQPEISIRGFNRELNNKVLVLIDGRTVYWDFIGTTQWGALPIVLEEIERIEVIRGPGSAVYGANAVTGVVNIITKAPGERPETQVRVEAGGPGYLRGTAMTSGRAGETAYRFSAGYRQHGRWEKPEDVGDGSAVVSFFPDKDQDVGARAVRAHGRIDRKVGSEGFVSLSGGYVDGQAEIYNIGALGDFGRKSVNTYARADASYGPVHARVFYNRVVGSTGPWVASPAEAERLTANDFVAQTVDAELEALGTVETGDVTHRINGGVAYRRKAIDDFSYLFSDDIDEDHFAAFINEEASYGDFRVVGSLRVDRHPLKAIDLTKTISPRLAGIWRIDEDRALRVSGGTAYRVPTLVESYMQTAIPTDVDGIYVRDVGSRQLVPERILTIESGYHDESTLYHQADVTVYYNRVTKLIGLSDVSPVNEPLDEEQAGFVAGETGWINQDDVYHGVGLEAEGEVYPLDGLDIFANITVQAVLVESPGASSLGQDRSPSLVKANLGVQYRSPYRIDVSGAAYFLSAQTWTLREFDASGTVVPVDDPIPARLIATARVAGRPFADDDLEISLVGWNLAGFATRYREHPKGQRLAPRVFGAVSYRF